MRFGPETGDIATVSFGENLKRIRIDRGFTSPGKLAKKISLIAAGNAAFEVSGRHIQRLEDGTSSPTLRTQNILARALGCTVADLVGKDGFDSDSDAVPGAVIEAVDAFYLSRKTRADLATLLSTVLGHADPVAVDSTRNVEPLRRLPTPPGNRRSLPESSTPPPPRRGQPGARRKR